MRCSGKLFSLAVAMVGLALAGGAAAQEPPVVAKASAAEKTRLQALIRDAAQEGALSYWDAVIQPETNDDLSAAFRKEYGLPASFKVNYTLSTTVGLVTRVDQELQANRGTIDIAAIASLPWGFDPRPTNDG